MTKTGYVYMLTNKRNNVFYVGVTSNLVKRIWEHKQKLVEGFSNKYNLNKLIYYELHNNIKDAIKREKYIKGKSRVYKLKLITQVNPDLRDIYEDIA